MPPLTLTSDFVFIRRDSEDFEQARSSLAAPDVRTDALRCLTIGGGLSVCALSGSENCPPHATGGKGLKTDEIGARAAGGHKARLCPAKGRRRALSCVSFSDGKRD